MQIDRRTFLWAAAGLAGCSGRTSGSPLQRAAAYLWAQQAEDGGFHSATYGLLRSGKSLTPFVLGALLDVPRPVCSPPEGAIERAFAFIRRHTNANGELGRMDETSADYPNYATALAVIAMAKARPYGWKHDVAPMIAQLRAQQFSEAGGWRQEDPAYGGWGMGGPIHRPPDAGHVDLSMTRFVLEALKAAGVSASDDAMTRAIVFLNRCRNFDGGFYFSPVNADINKAGESENGFQSYGTTTADGVLALRAAGVEDTDNRILRALQWLRERHHPDRVPGFDSGPRRAWGVGLRFYYAAAISRAVPELAVLLPEQQADGSFSNANSMVKEDDPLIATSFAIQVLAASNQGRSQE